MPHCDTNWEFDQRLGLLLRFFREQRGLTREQLAYFLGPPVKEQDLHDYEFGLTSVPICLLGPFSRTLSIPLAVLLLDFSHEDLAEWRFFQSYLHLVPSARRRVRRLVMQSINNLLELK